MKRIGPTSLELRNLIIVIEEKANSSKNNFWRRIAKDLKKSTRQRRFVNLFKLDKYTKENETVIVPGKVLGVGDLNHKLTVAAYQFSKSAYSKISNPITIKELLEKNPQGKGVRIIG